MTNRTLASAFRPATRFLRSTDLVRDFDDPAALNGYYLTDFGRSCLGRIAQGVAANSSARAWRLTGDYGSGKSSFALFLAACLADSGQLPKRLQAPVLTTAPDLKHAGYIPVLVTGTREPMSTAIIQALADLVARHFPRSAKSDLEDRLTKQARAGGVADQVVVQLIKEVTGKLVETGKGKGLLLILDEVGKFLEFAAAHPDQQDVFLLQKLAEHASRSGKAPFLFVCLLHQGFNAYADALSLGSKREWEKVAGRFEEIIFRHPLDQVVMLLAAALNIDDALLGPAQVKPAQAAMEAAIRLGWFGSTSSHKTLRDYAAQLYPIDPLVVPVMVRTFQRYGQNERSIFNFLFSYEAQGLQAYAARDLKRATPFRLHHFYDYIRANLGQRLAVASYRSHWSVIESVIDTFPSKDESEVQVMKTIGALNLLNSEDFFPTEDAIQWAVAGADPTGRKFVAQAIRRLRTAKLLYFRGEVRGYCLWPHSSVDIEARYDEAKREIHQVGSWAQAISSLLDTRPLVARRHYIESGNLRFLRVVYCPVDALTKQAEAEPADADGAILVPLCENQAEHRRALALGEEASVAKRGALLRMVAVPRPLDQLAGIILDSMRWDWVMTNTPELNSDSYAREEVSRFRTDAVNRLERAVQNFVGLNRTSSRLQLAWFIHGKRVKIYTGRELLSIISDHCDATFPKAPRIHNELVNRRSLSSAAAAARMRLIELMFSSADQPMLGITEGKNPPEKSMYLSVLKNTGLHRETKGKWQLGEPLDGDPCNVRPAVAELRTWLEKHADQRQSVASLMEHLRHPPYGLRDGIIPLLIAVVAIAEHRDVAVYENGTFLRDVGKDAFLRLSKNPERFDIQYCRIEGVRAELFRQLVTLLKLPEGKGKKTELLDLVRELCGMVVDAPEYSRQTKRLSKRALAVRAAILDAQEPIRLVFHQLPEACGFPVFGPKTVVTQREAESFANSLKDAVEEIRDAHPALETRILKALAQSFDHDENFAGMRRALSERAERLTPKVADMKLKAFCIRLEDAFLPQAQWVDSVGSLLGLRPPTKWKDEDEDVFNRELAELSGRFKRAEAVAFSSLKGNRDAKAIRVALTQADGSERHQVVFVSHENEKQLAKLKSEISKLVSGNRQIGVAAASQAIWDQLKELPE
jgi:hypothetical protein